MESRGIFPLGVLNPEVDLLRRGAPVSWEKSTQVSNELKPQLTLNGKRRGVYIVYGAKGVHGPRPKCCAQADQEPDVRAAGRMSGTSRGAGCPGRGPGCPGGRSRASGALWTGAPDFRARGRMSGPCLAGCPGPGRMSGPCGWPSVERCPGAGCPGQGAGCPGPGAAFWSSCCISSSMTLGTCPSSSSSPKWSPSHLSTQSTLA